MTKAKTKAKPLQFEWNLIVLVTTALVLFGLVMVYSATSGSAVLGHANPQGYVERQALFALAGLAALFVLSRLPLEKLRALAPTLLLGAAILCVGVLAIGSRINGARRWVDVGPLAFQPSEFAKLALVVWVAAYLSRHAAPRTPHGAREAGRSRRARLRGPRARRARPRHGAHDHARRRRDPPRLGHADVAPRHRLRDRHRARRHRCVVVAVPARPPPHVPRPVEGSRPAPASRTSRRSSAWARAGSSAPARGTAPRRFGSSPRRRPT